MREPDDRLRTSHLWLSFGRILERVLRMLVPAYRVEEDHRDSVLNYLKRELILGAVRHKGEQQYRNVFAKYGRIRPAYPPQMVAGLNELRVAARELLRRHGELGPIPPEASRSFLRWHEFYVAHDEAMAAELAVEAYTEGVTPDRSQRDRSFKDESAARKRAERQTRSLCERLDLTTEEFRQMLVEAERAADVEGSGAALHHHGVGRRLAVRDEPGPLPHALQ